VMANMKTTKSVPRHTTIEQAIYLRKMRKFMLNERDETPARKRESGRYQTVQGRLVRVKSVKSKRV